MADQSHTAGKGAERAAPLTAADEAALIQSFREHYDQLITQAKAALGPELEHFSGRISQEAMLATWSRRAEFTAPGAFADALHEAVRNESATQQRRHAALHHREGQASHTAHVTVPTVDEAVAQLVAGLHKAPIDHNAALSAARAASKHHAAAHVQKVARARSWKGPTALIVVLGVVIIGGMKWLSAAGTEVAVRKALAADDVRILSAARGQRGGVELSDGTTARIGSDSKLRRPNAFGTTMRTVQVEGTVSFTVAAGQPLPFTVWIGNAIVTATGTRFTVRGYEDDPMVVVGVEEGSVSVRAKDERGETAVAAGQSASIAPDGTVQMLDAAAAGMALSWVRDSLVLENTPAGTALVEMSRWFNTSATLADSSLASRPVTLRIGLESSGDALAAFAAAANLAVGFDADDKVVLTDAPPVPAKPARRR